MSTQELTELEEWIKDAFDKDTDPDTKEAVLRRIEGQVSPHVYAYVLVHERLPPTFGLSVQ